MIEYAIIDIMQGDGADAFNYFFTVVCAFGLFAFGIGLLFKIINRS